MAPKRKKDETEEMTSRERKKLKVADARTIAVQPAASASGGVGVQSSGNALAGPSSTTIRFDSMRGLPASIDVERFTEARAYEIDAMQKAIKTAGESATHRAWQTLPRHLRRRAASHDVRRVPLRLREKARAEMDPVKKRVLGRGRQPKRGKTKQVNRTESFLKRQRDKSWLETHIWHAKRMKMENMWGYRLAVTPTEKSFRPSHRASVHGSILHDASYYSLIELKGPENIIQRVLEICCDPQCIGMKRSMSGARVLETDIYEPGSYPFDLIAPVTIMWCPLPAGNAPAPTKAPLPEGPSEPKRKGKEKQSADAAPQSLTRTVWVRTHPAAFDDVFEALQKSASLALEAEKQRHKDVYAEIEIADLRGSVNVFEIMGPKASQVIKGALSPVADDDRQEFKKFWSSLGELQSTASLPRGMVIGMKVLDPRLKFPPKNAKLRTNDQHAATTMTFPAAILAQSEIWEEEKRSALQKPKFKKKDLDERRSKNLVPGTPLNPLRQDDRIPLLLIQRSLEAPSSTHGIHGWTLIFPAGWGMPFQSSLTHTGTRVGGQRERRTQSFEAGTPYFPRDFPCTKFYEKHWAERADDERAKWERTPPAKRPNHEKLGTRSPWLADWEVVLGLTVASGADKDLVPAQREPQDTMEVDRAPTVRPWLLHGREVPAILAKVAQMFNHGAGLLAEINRVRTKRGMDALDASCRPGDLMKGALVMVRMKMLGRGAPDDLANIYRVDDAEAKKWIKEKGKKRDDAEMNETSEPAPPHSSIVGYVTTGNMSLSRGEGFAIGGVPVSVLLELQQQAQRIGELRPLVKIRDRAGIVCRAAHLELLDS